MIRSMLKEIALPYSFWGKAFVNAYYILSLQRYSIKLKRYREECSLHSKQVVHFKEDK
jgi:hypothetical protein